MLTDKQKDLLKNCRYYHGEETCPFTTFPLVWFWDMERVYININGTAGGEAGYYNCIGGKSYPGIPNNLVTIMFTSWGKSAYDVKAEISAFYKMLEEYLEIASDHYSKDKLPSIGRICN